MPLDSLHKFAAQVDELKKVVDDAIAHAATPHAEGAAVAPTAIDFQQLIALVMQLLPIIIALFQPKSPVPTPPG